MLKNAPSLEVGLSLGAVAPEVGGDVLRASRHWLQVALLEQGGCTRWPPEVLSSLGCSVISLTSDHRAYLESLPEKQMISNTHV